MIIGNAVYLGGTPLPPLTNPASASDVLDGKEVILPDANDEPIVVTGTLVPPVDTGESGNFKRFLESAAPTELVSDELTALGARCKSAVYTTVRCPNVTRVVKEIFLHATNLTGIIRLDSYDGYVGDGYDSYGLFEAGLARTCCLYIKKYTNYIQFKGKAQHIWLPITQTSSNYTNQNASVISLQFDAAKSINGYYLASTVTKTIIVRSTNFCALTHQIRQSAFASGGDGRIYVPKSLLSSYATATNWVTNYNDGQIIGIDQDTTATVGTPFAPTTSATVDHWDQVDLQSYSVGTIDTTDGSITPTHDGRLLIRGLDANDEIVHVTYLQIGTGFDEEANLA